MTDKDVSDRRFYKAKQEAGFAEKQLITPQTQSTSYRLAFQDTEFLLREELLPVLLCKSGGPIRLYLSCARV